MSLHWTLIVLSILLIINTLISIVIVMRQPRDISATWAWLLVLIGLPGIGYLLFMFLGRGLSQKKKFKLQLQNVEELNALSKIKRKELHQKRYIDGKYSEKSKELIKLFYNIGHFPLTNNNSVEIFTSGAEKFTALFKDIQAAQKYIYLEYYAIKDDSLGRKLRDALIDKVNQGIEVKVLYDAWGSGGKHHILWQPLVAAGGQVEQFITSKHVITDFRLNYRGHRKLVVIDDKISYIGGFNVGDQYLGESKKFGNWRDTHIRVTGVASLSIKVRFAVDWNASTNKQHQLSYQNLNEEIIKSSHQQDGGASDIQIVSSGPDSDIEQIKKGYIKMISTARDSVYIQTPYLIPDDSMLDTLQTAAASGVSIKIMVPSMPDHMFVYRATQYYMTLLMDSGIDIYMYEQGFIHAKTIIIDGQIASVGSANVDFRSFSLNFESNAVIYDQDIAGKLITIFNNDLTNSVQLTTEIVESYSYWLKIKQRFSRLLSPIL